MSGFYNPRSSRNFVDAFRHRQLSTSYNRELETKWYVTPEFIHRLRLWDQLEGHTGCVNCLQWNENGSILASGSDDYQVILWDPFNRRKIQSVQTGHTNNIFSVQFAPERNDNVIITAAGDGRVRVHDISSVSAETLQVYSCHFARVKRLAVTPMEPNIVLSAGEDGVVMQFDLRAPANCRDICNHVLVNLNAHVGPEAEVKCISLNPCRPEMMAIGANDPFVRVYDRRMLRPKRIRITPVSGRDRPVWDRQAILSLALDDENYDFPMSSVQYYVAAHLPVKYRELRRRLRTLASTYVTFSPCGGDLLVNLGGEQIYLFDINGRRRSLLTDLRKYFSTGDDGASCGHSNGCVSNGLPLPSSNGFSKKFSLSATLVNSGNNSEPKRRPALPPRAELLKQRANSCFEKRDFNLAIMFYSQAALIAPKAPVIFANRAAAYMKRNWDGDVYAALRDCHTTLILDPDHLKAHFRLARCLHLLNHQTEGRSALDMFKTKFPDQSKTQACMELDEAVDKAMKSNSSAPDAAQPGTKRDRSGSLSDIDTGDNSGNSSDGAAADPGQARTNDSSDQETAFQDMAADYDLRFCGHCNTTTDIKEANFFGPHGEYIIAGSDDGRFFIWEKKTCSIVRILQGDESIVNCLQPHPTQCLLATSGIETTVKLWCPMPEDGTKDPRVVMETEFDSTALQNQRRMNTDPLEIMLQNMGYRLSGFNDSDGNSRPSGSAVQCNQS